MNPLYIIAAVMGVFFLIWALTKLFTNDGNLDHHLQAFWRERRGVPFADQQAELTLRMTAATLRRRTSEAVLKAPAQWDPIVRRITDELALGLMTRNKELAQLFVAWAVTAPLQDILYPDAYKAAYQVMTRPRNMVLKTRAEHYEDLVASLRVR